MNRTERFLTALFGETVSPYRFLVWEFHRSAPVVKESRWCETPVQACGYIEKAKKDRDVYVGVGLSPKDYGPKLRCKAGDVTGIVGLWADIDIKSPAHKKENLPPSVEEAKGLLEKVKLAPSILLHSGNGLQAWWLFDEPWIFESEKDRQDASDLASAWVYTLKHYAGMKGWDVDSTISLAQVLRIPGTLNHKSDPPGQVTVLEWSEERYSPGEFETFVTEEAWASVRQRSLGRIDDNAGVFVLRADAQPPFDRFQALLYNDDKFKASWEHKRKDLQDQSASAYDLSLATMAYQTGWSDQDIVDLLIAHRRRFGEDLKLREDYYTRTLGRAKEGVESIRDQAETMEDLTRLKNSEDVPEEERKPKMIDHLRKLLDIPVTRIVKYTTDPPQYRFVFESGDDVLCRTPSDVTSQTRLRDAIWGVTGKYIPPHKPGPWKEICEAIAGACEIEDPGDEGTERGITQSWLEGYLEDKPPEKVEQGEGLVGLFELRRPFCLNDSPDFCHIFLDDFKGWIATNRHERISVKQLAVHLRSIGCSPRGQNIVIDGKPTTRRVWQVPLEEVVADG